MLCFKPIYMNYKNDSNRLVPLTTKRDYLAKTPPNTKPNANMMKRITNKLTIEIINPAIARPRGRLKSPMKENIRPKTQRI